jgi:2-methylfumaryl-CoA isomerase
VVRALGLTEGIAALEARRGVDFSADEGLRHTHREAIDALIEPAVAALTSEELAARLEANDVLWGPYRTLSEAMAVEPELSDTHPMMARIRHPGGLEYRTPGSPVQSSLLARESPEPAPAMGEHTAAVLAEVLGLTDAQLGRLIDQKLI